MSCLRTTLSATVFVSALLLSVAVQAGDVTVDYSQLDGWPSAGPVPIVIHPLAKGTTLTHPLARIQTNAIQNLAAEARESIHLTPPAPKTFATLTPPKMPVAPAAPITEIDFSLAALPPVTKPEPAKSEPVLADIPVVKPMKQPEAETEVAKTEMPVTASIPVKTWSPSTPIQPIQARATVSKMDDLRPEDVVAIDIGAPPKQTVSQ